jgi:hypothetical protein
MESAGEIAEDVQGLVVRTIATHPVGERLCLIGGFRFRLLDASCRRSLDIDYHWDGDLEAKQNEVVRLLRKKLLPLVRTRLGLEGDVRPVCGPDADSPAVKTVELSVWREHGPGGRITIPIDITRIPCLDKPAARTLNGVVYLSASDADMAESKIVSLFARVYLAERDMLDLFLFHDQLPPDSAARLAAKFSSLQMDPSRLAETWRKIRKDRDYHVRNLDAILKEQVDPSVSVNLRAAGGGGAIFDRVVDILISLLPLPKETP